MAPQGASPEFNLFSGEWEFIKWKIYTL
jgi:hypothetical protein